MIVPFVASLTHNSRIIPDLILIILTGGLWIPWILLRTGTMQTHSTAAFTVPHAAGMPVRQMEQQPRSESDTRQSAYSYN